MQLQWQARQEERPLPHRSAP
eukprot:SAG11_NODE_39869_length_219_cov_2.608333_1_plen_20_part_01